MTTLTRVLDVPEIPPIEWFREDPDWFVPGQTLQIRFGDGEEEGRVAGLIQPPPGMTRYSPGRNGQRHRNWGRRPPDARLYPDGMETFNRGPIQVLDAGVVTSIQGGALPLLGDHAESAVAATNLGQAVEWLHREGRFRDQAGDLGVVGVASPVDTPGYEGAVMFRGAAIPGLTVREAALINATSTSAEVWPSAKHDGALVFAGAIRCDHTAWPYEVPESLAAGVDGEDCADDECVGPHCTIRVFGVDTDRTDAAVDEMVSTGEGRSVARAVAAAAYPPDGEPSTGDTNDVDADLEPDETAIDDTDTHIAAEGDASSPEMLALISRLDTIETNVTDVVEAVSDLTIQFAELTLTIYGPDALGQRNEVADLNTRLGDLHERVEELVRRLPDPDRLTDPNEEVSERPTVAPSASETQSALGRQVAQTVSPLRA